MIDTVVLMLNHPEHFHIADHERFSPSTIGLFQAPYYKLGGRGNYSCYQNPTAEELKNGIYKPRLTVTRRVSKGGLPVTLRIEFSVPKLIFGNNFDEVDDANFAQVADILLRKLREMGIIIFKNILLNAPVSSVHYSKNIPLLDGSTPYTILKEIAKINLTQRLDLNQTDFRNEGHCLKFHTNSYELALYDKLKDIEKSKVSEKRAVEKGTAIQLHLFDSFKPKKPFEVLRIEARLNKREVIRQFLKKAEVNANPTFAELFKKDISRKVLLSFVEDIERDYALLAYNPKTFENFVADFRINQPKVKIRKMLQIYGLIDALRLGARKFREVTKSYGKHNFPRLMKELKLCKFKTCFSAIKPLIDGIIDFKPLKLADYCQKETTGKSHETL